MKGKIYEYRVRRLRLKAAESIPGSMTCPEMVAKIFRQRCYHGDREHMYCFHLDSQSAIVGLELVSIGGLDGVEVHPREIFRSAILTGARAIILAHNHPSGKREPSAEDDKLTARIHQAGMLLGIPLCDHVVVTDDSHFSYMAEHRIIPLP